MQLIHTAVGVVVALHTVALAAPKPQIAGVLEAPGIALGQHVIATAFCDSSARAVLLLLNGDVVAVDAAAKMTSIGNIGGTAPRASMACDRSDRIVVARKGELVVFDRGAMTTVKASITMPIAGRTLADGSVAFASSGTVVHWDGTQVDEWSFPPPAYLDKAAISGDGRAIAGFVKGVTTVFDAAGTFATPPPRASAVAWAPDSQSLFATTQQGLLRWKVGAAATDVTVVDAKLRGHTIGVAGRRLVVITMGSTNVIELDAKGAPVGATVSSTRWPGAFAHLAAGDAPFAVVAGDQRAYVLDLTTSGPLIDAQHVVGSIRGLAFSPDGRSLAFGGGANDIVVADVVTGAITERLPVKMLGVDQVRWTRDAIIVAGFRTLVKWNRDRAMTETTTSVGSTVDEAGEIVDGATACGKLPPPGPMTGFGPPPAPTRVDASSVYFAAACRQGLTVFRAKDLTVVAQTTARPYAFALGLAGKQPRAFYAERLDIHAVDAKGDTRVITLPRLTGTPVGAILSIVASRDRRRLAVAMTDQLVIIDVARMAPVMAEPTTDVSAIAWSPDGKQLAVAHRAGIDMWTLPRLK